MESENVHVLAVRHGSAWEVVSLLHGEHSAVLHVAHHHLLLLLLLEVGADLTEHVLLLRLAKARLCIGGETQFVSKGKASKGNKTGERKKMKEHTCMCCVYWFTPE